MQPSPKPSLMLPAPIARVKLPVHLRLALTDCGDRAARKILEFQALRFLHNLTGVLGGGDPEFVHQGRVAIRRTRSALKLFRRALPGRESQRLRSFWKTAAEALGEVRDLDVFSDHLKSLTGKTHARSGLNLEGLFHFIRERRFQRLQQAIRWFTRPAFVRFLDSVDRFLSRPLAQAPTAPWAKKPIPDIFQKLVQKAFRRVLRRGRRVEKRPSPAGFHRLRILCKQLRYACEFFEPLMEDLAPRARAGGRTRARVLGNIIQLQNCLGKIQDTVFARSVLVAFLEKNPQAASEVGRLQARQQRLAQEQSDRFMRLWAVFDSKAQKQRLARMLQGK